MPGSMFFFFSWAKPWMHEFYGLQEFPIHQHGSLHLLLISGPLLLSVPGSRSRASSTFHHMSSPRSLQYVEQTMTKTSTTSHGNPPSPQPRSTREQSVSYADLMKPDEDWRNLPNAADRRKIQNRLAQRAYREWTS